MRPDVQHDLIAGEKARTAVVQLDLDRLGRHEMPAPHDQLGTALLVGVEMEGDLAIDHGALALADCRHVRLDRRRSLRRTTQHGAPDSRPGRSRFRSCWAGRPRSGTSRPPIAVPPRPSAGPSCARCQASVLAALPAAQNDGLESVLLGHGILPKRCCEARRIRCPASADRRTPRTARRPSSGTARCPPLRESRRPRAPSRRA